MQIQLLTKHKYKYNCSFCSAGPEKKGGKSVKTNANTNIDINRTQIQIQQPTLLEVFRKKGTKLANKIQL